MAATTKDDSALSGPIQTIYWAGGHATDWCVVTPPPWARCVTVTNRGTAAMYVAVTGSTSPTGTASATHANAKIVASGGSVTLALAPRDKHHAPGTFSEWGADGATHAMDFLYDGDEA